MVKGFKRIRLGMMTRNSEEERCAEPPMGLVAESGVFNLPVKFADFWTSS